MVYRSTFPDLDIPKCNVLSFLFPKDKQPSDKPIWIDAADPDHFLTPRQLLSWVKRLGSGLDRLGVTKQEVVMIFTPNHIFVPVAYLGIVGASRIFSAANPVYTVTEVEYQIKNTGTRCILVHPEHVETAVEAARRAGLDKSRIFQFSDKPCPTKMGIRDWREAMAGSEKEAEAWMWDPMTETSTTDIATINYSSGTTGLPKGVCVSHHNLLANVVQTIFIRDQEQPYNTTNQPQERWVGFLPLYHAYGKQFILAMLLSTHHLRPTLLQSDGANTTVPNLHHEEVRLRRLLECHQAIQDHKHSGGPSHPRSKSLPDSRQSAMRSPGRVSTTDPSFIVATADETSDARQATRDSKIRSKQRETYSLWCCSAGQRLAKGRRSKAEMQHHPRLGHDRGHMWIYPRARREI